MYLNFFNLRKKPFHITPDPEFLYLSKSHKEAYGSLFYGIQNRKGFISIAGEVGTGKTTILRAFLEQIDRDHIKPVYIFNADLSFEELIRIIFRELDLTPAGDNTENLILYLQEILIEEYRKEKTIVLIIDEAQNMPVETLEKLRMLSNLETNKEKLLQIILVGQPELENKLNQQELRQLKQRLALRATIHPLSHRESLAYIQHRLSLSSGSPKKIFSGQASRAISKFAKGFPRVLNVLCDNALIAAYGYQKKIVSVSIVREVIRDYQGVKSLRANLRQIAPVIGFILVAFILFHPQLGRYLASLNLYSVDNQTLTSEVMTDNEKEIFIKSKSGVMKYSWAEPFSERNGPERRHAINGWNSTYLLSEPGSVWKIQKRENITPAANDMRNELVAVQFPEEKIVTPQELETQAQNYSDLGSSFILRVVDKGDVFSRLCVEVYGRGVLDSDLIQRIKKYNPHIKDENVLQVGDKILFPVSIDAVQKAL